MSVGEQIANSPEVRACMEVVYAKFAIIDSLRAQVAAHEQNVASLTDQVNAQEQSYATQQALYAGIIQNLINFGASAPEIASSQLVLESALEANAIKQTITTMQSQIQNIRDTIANIDNEIVATQALVESALGNQVGIIQGIMTTAELHQAQRRVDATVAAPATADVSAAASADVSAALPAAAPHVDAAQASADVLAAPAIRQSRIRVPRPAPSQASRDKVAQTSTVSPATSPPGSAIVAEQSGQTIVAANPRAWPIGTKK